MGAHAQRLDRGLDGGVRRHQQDAQLLVQIVRAPHHVEARQAGQAEVGDQDGVGARGEEPHGLFARGDGRDRVTQPAQVLCQRVALRALVLHDQDPVPWRAHAT